MREHSRDKKVAHAGVASTGKGKRESIKPRQGRHWPLERAQEPQSAALRKRRAFEITETELKLMAAAAIIGLSKSPKNG